MELEVNKLLAPVLWYTLLFSVLFFYFVHFWQFVKISIKTVLGQDFIVCFERFVRRILEEGSFEVLARSLIIYCHD